MDINFKILQIKYFNDLCHFNDPLVLMVIKIFALRNFKINIHEGVLLALLFIHSMLNSYP